MADCIPSLEDCLADDEFFARCSCDIATELKKLAMLKIRETLCTCTVNKPIEFGGVRYPSPREFIQALKMVIELAILVCKDERSGEPVHITIYEDRCGSGSSCHTSCREIAYDQAKDCGCSGPCGHSYRKRYHVPVDHCETDDCD